MASLRFVLIVEVFIISRLTCAINELRYNKNMLIQHEMSSVDANIENDLDMDLVAPSFLQYVFAHRVNSKKVIKLPLEAGANGIEIDICVYKGVWYVSHNDFGFCKNPLAPKLSSWLLKLKQILKNHKKYKNMFAMLWLDIKTPGNKLMKSLPQLVHAINLPSTVRIMYDLAGYTEASRRGFKNIYQLLTDTESISFCAGGVCGGSLKTITEIYNYFKQHKFQRGTFNSGSPAISEAKNYRKFLKYANSHYTDPSDEYRFKLIFTWTQCIKKTMAKYMNLKYRGYTDGQIVGGAFHQWNQLENTNIKTFKQSMGEMTRLATPNDDPFHSLVRPLD